MTVFPKNLQFKLIYPQNLSFSKRDYLFFNRIKTFVEQIETFKSPKILSEQYSLPSDLISFILVLSKTDLTDRNITDLGCGTGRFTLPISKFFQGRVIGVDNDFSAIEHLRVNMKKLHLHVDLLTSAIEFVEATNWKKIFQTTIMNPPFGTQRKGIDQVFLRKALTYSEVVLSLHKTSDKSRNLWKRIASSYRKRSEILATVEFPLQRTFKFHTRNQHNVKVDLIRFSHGTLE